MANLMELKVLWQGWPGSPGYSTFYFDTSQTTAAASVRSFFDAIKAYLPQGLTIQVAGSGDILDEATGQINNSWSAAAPAVVTGTGVGAYAGATGAVVHWLSNTVVAGRRLRGRTFLVPLVATAFHTDGSLAVTPQSTLQTAAAGLVTAETGIFRVWHRPGQFTGGSSGTVTSSSVPDLAVVLRSRRT